MTPEPPIGPLSDSPIDVKRLRLKPGDIVVVNVDRDISAADAAHIKATIEPIIAPHRVLVMSRGVLLEILEPADD